MWVPSVTEKNFLLKRKKNTHSLLASGNLLQFGVAAHLKKFSLPAQNLRAFFQGQHSKIYGRPISFFFFFFKGPVSHLCY